MPNITRVLENVRDGDTVLIKSQSAGSTIFDPANEYGGAARAFRVVVQEGLDPIFVLVPLGEAVMVKRRLM